MPRAKKEEKESKEKKPAVAKKSEKAKPVKKAPAVKPKKTLKKTPAEKPAAKKAPATQSASSVKKPRQRRVAPKAKAAAEKPHLPVAPDAAQQPAAVSKPPVAPQPPAAPKPAAASRPVSPEQPARKPERPALEPEVRALAEKTAAPAPEEKLQQLELQLPITVKELAVRLQEKPSVLIKTLMGMRVMCGINQTLEESVVKEVCAKYKCTVKPAPGAEEIALKEHTQSDPAVSLRPRSPIVTFMGHVDHGKTSLLDAIRKSRVAEREHGGITQHIGAYHVQLANGQITFLDTPGHEAFTAMRARGAGITDIVVLVVAADDGIMPQTEEAIDHAKAAGVSIIVAMNKIDKAGADPEKVKKQLTKYELTPEEWGGKTITVGVSAKTGEGIDTLLEMIVLESQMLELKANPLRPARGVVLEAKICKGKGPTATLLIENGTLHLNQHILVGNFYGKIRAMFNDRGVSVTEAGPSCAVEVLGITGVPEAGEQFFVISEEKQAKELAQARSEKERLQQMRQTKHVTLEDLHAQIAAGTIKDLKLIIKADVQGSLEAIKDTLAKLPVSEIKLTSIHTGVGNINASDVILAAASDALIIGFHVVADDRAKELADKEGVEIKIYNIIYELANEIRAAIEGMLEPKLKKIFLGKAVVKKVFRLSSSGMVAGCQVVKGKIPRSSVIAVVRNGEEVFTGKLSSLKRFKDDVREVAEGFECGMTVQGFEQLQEGDVIEAHDVEKIARKL